MMQFRHSYLALALAAAFATTPAVRAQAPIPVADGYQTKGFAGWTRLTDGLPTGVSYVHRPDDRALAGAFAWFEAVPASAAVAAFEASARTHGVSELRTLATSKVERAVLLDAGGSGTTLIGQGLRKGQPVRMVAFVFYGSTNKTPRMSGVHGFIAPLGLYEAMGGWTVPASLWMKLDPQREVRDVRAQGAADPAVQTQRFADIANMWSQWALNTMRGLAQGNVAAMSSARQTIVCAGDPQCRIVPVN